MIHNYYYFSATWPPGVRRLISDYMKQDPFQVTVGTLDLRVSVFIIIHVHVLIIFIFVLYIYVEAFLQDTVHCTDLGTDLADAT